MLKSNKAALLALLLTISIQAKPTSTANLTISKKIAHIITGLLVGGIKGYYSAINDNYLIETNNLNYYYYGKGLNDGINLAMIVITIDEIIRKEHFRALKCASTLISNILTYRLSRKKTQV